MPKATPPRLLVVDDETIARQNLAHILKREGWAVDEAADGETALAHLRETPCQVVLTDLRMPGMDGLSLLLAIKAQWPACEVIVITAHASTGSAVEAMKAGAFYYIEKPYRLPDVRKVVREALEKAELLRENAALKTALSLATGQGRILTHCPAMADLLALAQRIAPTDCAVLICGETGTGKELLARHVHDQSQRASAPFVALNCGAFNEDLLANELFGHEKGAFTGASGGKRGLLETAQGGTLFLDEVTEMSTGMQVKLLRVLQEKEFLRIGGLSPLRCDIRIIAATNRSPQQAMAEGRLRQDFYFRLNVVTLDLPPLRQRRGDIPSLAAYFMSRAAQRMGKRMAEIAPAALDALLTYDFPGNIRELENLMERAVALAQGDTITLAELPDSLGHTPLGEPVSSPDRPLPTLAEMEAAHIQRALLHTGGNRAAAAQLLGIDRVSLWRKLRQAGEK